jgi:hypothetical protein
MKHLLITTIAAVVLVGCGPPETPGISIHIAGVTPFFVPVHSGALMCISVGGISKTSETV